MTEEEVRIESKREIYDSLPKLVVYVSIAILIYLFAILVFVPLGNGLDIIGVSTATIISASAIIAIMILLWRSSREIKDLCNAIGGLIAVNVGREGASDEEVAHYQKAVKGIVSVFAVVVAFLFIGSLLTEISEGAAGILLIVIFLWAVCTLYSSGMAISAEIEATANEVAQKLEKSAAREARED
ncbi:MAG: hypothetical protein U9N43_06375 [Euryarchaeota archaeon]|nr:hypothetical protein [Euryarchaeota archaeon]